MGLFSPRREHLDDRSRECVLTGTPIIAADGVLVGVTLTVRFDAVPPGATESGRPGGAAWWHTAGEHAIHVVIVTALRLHAETTNGDDLVAGRAEIAAAVDRVLELAPVAAGFRARTVHVETTRGPADVRGDLHFRIIPTAR